METELLHMTPTGRAVDPVSFARTLRQHGGRTALFAPDGTPITYELLADRVDDYRTALGPGRRLVLVEGDRTAEAVIAYLASLASGCVVLLTAPGTAGHGDGPGGRFDPDVLATAASGWEPHLRRRGSAHDLHPDLALLLSTSGSTGAAKLVRLSSRNLEANADSIADYLGLGPSDTAMASLPLHYCYGLSVLHSHLRVGAAVALGARSVVDPCFWEQFRSTAATSLAGVPHTFELLERVGFDAMELPSLRRVTQAGGRLAPRLVRRYAELAERGGWQFFVMYGQTEATARMAYVPPDQVMDHPSAIGIPVPGGSFRLERRGDEPTGELVYRGPNVMMGYATRPTDLALGRTLDELHTGDLARLDADGMYEIVGRASRFIKPLGIRIDLGALEESLGRDWPEVACTGDDRRLIVAVAGGGEPERTRAEVCERLGLPAASLVMRRFDELPRLESGKPDYPAIRDAAAEPAVGDAATSVRALFTELLRADRVGDADTFVTLGGDSLSYVEASMRLERLLGRVPTDWHVLPVTELEELATGSGNGPRLWQRSMETNVVVRALAILLVVGTHTGLFRQQGGAHLLLVLAGYNFARFQLGEDTRETTRRTVRAAGRIAVPTLALTALAMSTQEGFAPSNLLLLNNYLGQGRWWYWYVEALLQVLLIAAILFLVPAVRRLEQTRPFGFALGLLVAALAARSLPLDPGPIGRPLILSHVIAWMFVLGWLLRRSTSTITRLAATALTLLTVPGTFEDPSRAVVVAGGTLLVLWVPQLRVPPPCQRIIGVVAAASLYIYLSHFHLYPQVRDAHGPLWSAAASLAVGIGLWWLVSKVGRTARLRFRGRRSATCLRDADAVPA
jgi:acyl-CoA synthetase (AMP-forming)/AMP-acid ligase II/acyl carrier protein